MTKKPVSRLKRFGQYLYQLPFRLRRKLPLILLAIFCGAFLVLAVNVYMILNGERFIEKDAAAFTHKQVALIPGARILGKNTVSYILADRLDAGIELYRAGKVDKLLVSGDHGQPEYDEVNVMRRYLLAAGIPARDIFMDHAGFDTYDSVYRAQAIFGVKSMIIVSQRFHLYRAIYIAQALDIDVAGMDATHRDYGDKTMLHNDVRETMARVKAFFDVLLHIGPTYLGVQIPITGDGRLTNDQ